LWLCRIRAKRNIARKEIQNMPEYLSPGVYVEEIEIGSKPIEGVSTSTAGFVGESERGPIDARLITGFVQYERLYGNYAWKTAQGKMSNSYLPYAVAGFFANGGKRCFIGRITGKGSAPATLTLNGKIDVTAIGPGDWGNRIGVAIKKASMAKKEENTDKRFRLVVYYWSESPKPKDPAKPIIDPADRDQLKNPDRREPAVHEEFDNLCWDSSSPDYYLTRLHEQSHLIEVTPSATPEPPPPRRTPSAIFGGSAPSQDEPTSPTEPEKSEPEPIQLLSGGKDGAQVETADYTGENSPPDNPPSGLKAFAVNDEISIVCAPNEVDVPGLSDAIVTHCENMMDRFAILQAKQDAGEVGNLFPSINSKYAAFYYPWIKVIDPVTNLPKLIPPGGQVAGIYARSDIERGVHKAPANEPVRGAIDLQLDVAKGAQDVLNPRGVNCIRTFTGRGILLWGARTTSDDPAWKYVNVRRLFLFLEKSIERSTQWLVFEPNDERLWARVRQSVSDFLTQVWKDGALMGTTTAEAFFVKCDNTTMTPSEIELGKLIIIVGVAVVRPAEFVIFRLAQWRSGSSITE
jgi:phage tail sheath protein FI